MGLADGVRGLPGLTITQPVQGSAVFATLPAGLISSLQQEWNFHAWGSDKHVVRWMTAFDTSADDVDEFIASIRTHASADIS